jgi:hypothetical protein
MQTHGENSEIAAIKDDAQRPIPSAWRPIIEQIVDALVRHDYRLGAGIFGVAPVSEETAAHIQDTVEDYGETLVSLPDDSWNTSVCMWTGHHWDVLVDLWTIGEGRSDLVLELKVLEGGENYTVDIHMVYVP